MTEVEKLPREILEKAVRLRNHHRKVFLALYTHGPSTAKEIAELTGHARAYVHMRLIELADRGLVKTIREGKKVKFEVVT